MPTTHDPDDPDFIFAAAAGAPFGAPADPATTADDGDPGTATAFDDPDGEGDVASTPAEGVSGGVAPLPPIGGSSVYVEAARSVYGDSGSVYDEAGPTRAGGAGGDPTGVVALDPTGSVYPDGVGSGAFVERHGGTAPSWGSPRLPPSSGQIFERRQPSHGPRPDEYGYYPDDYYLPTDWPRLITKAVLGLAVVLVLAIAGFELYDRYSPTRVDDEAEAEPTPTPIPLVEVFVCAGDAEPVAQREPPSELLIAGRTADSRWLAFRNPEAPPLQLWVLAADVPDFDPSTVGLVSCADSPDTFPTPFGTGAG